MDRYHVQTPELGYFAYEGKGKDYTKQPAGPRLRLDFCRQALFFSFMMPWYRKWSRNDHEPATVMWSFCRSCCSFDFLIALSWISLAALPWIMRHFAAPGSLQPSGKKKKSLLVPINKVIRRIVHFACHIDY